MRIFFAVALCLPFGRTHYQGTLSSHSLYLSCHSLLLFSQFFHRFWSSFLKVRPMVHDSARDGLRGREWKAGAEEKKEKMKECRTRFWGCKNCSAPAFAERKIDKIVMVLCKNKKSNTRSSFILYPLSPEACK